MATLGDEKEHTHGGFLTLPPKLTPPLSSSHAGLITRASLIRDDNISNCWKKGWENKIKVLKIVLILIRLLIYTSALLQHV